KTNAIGPPTDVEYLTVPTFATPGAGIRMNILPSSVSGQDGWVFCGTRWDDQSGEIRVVRYIYIQPRGTISLINSNTAITGTNTLWTQDLSKGDKLIFTGDATTYEITAVTSNTQATITPAWGGTTSGGHTATITDAQGNWYDGELGALVNQDAARPPRAAG